LRALLRCTGLAFAFSAQAQMPPLPSAQAGAVAKAVMETNALLSKMPAVKTDTLIALSFKL
jgi:hypothetical protein